MSQALRSLISAMAETIRAKSIAGADAYWRLATTGTEADARRAAELETDMRLFLSDPETFTQLKEARAHPSGDALLDRQVGGLYNAYLENQLSKEEIADLVDRANELEQIFSNFRGTVDGRPMSAPAPC